LKNNVIYYANGTYKSKQGDISGYWDGTAEKKEIEKMNNGKASPKAVEKINSYIEKQDAEPYEGYGDESISFYNGLLG
jgi:flagellar hook assembly protein FlgD